jgi:hypothetical protein
MPEASRFAGGAADQIRAGDQKRDWLNVPPRTRYVLRLEADAMLVHRPDFDRRTRVLSLLLSNGR